MENSPRNFCLAAYGVWRYPVVALDVCLLRDRRDGGFPPEAEAPHVFFASSFILGVFDVQGIGGFSTVAQLDIFCDHSLSDSYCFCEKSFARACPQLQFTEEKAENTTAVAGISPKHEVSTKR